MFKSWQTFDRGNVLTSLFVHGHNWCMEHGAIFCVGPWVSQQGVLKQMQALGRSDCVMSSFPRVSVCGSGVSFSDEEAAWLSHDIWILSMLMRTQHYQKPWTRADFCFPLTHKGTSSPLVVERVWNTTAPHRLTYLNTCSLVGTVGNRGCRKWGLAGRDGSPYVWVSEDIAQCWSPRLSLGPGPEATRSFTTCFCRFEEGQAGLE